MLKAGGEVVVDWLAKVFNIVWREGVAPSEWKNAVIVPVYKKGSRLECTNYRRILPNECCWQDVCTGIE